MFPGPIELLLIGYSLELSWIPKIQIKYITKNQLADTLTKGNFTRDEWNHLLCLTLAISVLQYVLKQWQKEYNKIQVKKESHSEVEANDEPCCKGSRPGQPVVDRNVYSARYSRWDDDKACSSQEWKADKSMDDRKERSVVTSWGETHESQSSFFHEKTQHVIVDEEEPHDRTRQPVVYPQREARPQQFIVGNDETESEMSMGSRSFLNRVNNQVRKRQKRSSMNIAENDGKHSMIWGMFMSCL